MPRTEPTPRRYAQLCGIATALDVIGDRWAVLIVRDLLLGPLRFGQLAHGLPGIGTNTLAARLMHLEASGVIRRQLVPLPGRGAVYELTPDGVALEPVLMGLGRWGTKHMDRLPPAAVSRSRWLAAAMLAFHDGDRTVSRPTTWELRLTDGAFTVRASQRALTVSAGAPDQADAVISTDDETLHRLLTDRLTPSSAVASGAAIVEGDASALPALIELFSFPSLDFGDAD